MTALKFDAKVSASAAEALEPHVRPLYDRPGARRLAIVEFAHTERIQPAPGSEKEPAVKVRITHLEIPNADQEGTIREAQRALYLQRTATGTLQEDGELELSEQTLRLTGGMLHAIEAARLKAGLAHWLTYIHRVVQGPDLTVSEMRHELDQVAAGLTTALRPARDNSSDDDA
ncbi:hypothetical protein [Streptomyces sp. NPDC091212]|uniref:hypothetical protein n=1 Tax=Streptomyces sp. NPDC091212 TaxID=3155191 RepID=UPI00342474FE